MGKKDNLQLKKNRINNSKILKKAGMEFSDNSGGVHLFMNVCGKQIHYWPGPDNWVVVDIPRVKGQMTKENRQEGVYGLIKRINFMKSREGDSFEVTAEGFLRKRRTLSEEIIRERQKRAAKKASKYIIVDHIPVLTNRERLDEDKSLIETSGLTYQERHEGGLYVIEGMHGEVIFWSLTGTWFCDTGKVGNSCEEAIAYCKTGTRPPYIYKKLNARAAYKKRGECINASGTKGVKVTRIRRELPRIT